MSKLTLVPDTCIQQQTIVVDLFDVQSNKEISLEEVMDGLRYVMEYRIKGGRFPSLDYDIMKRLADGLLMNMGDSEKTGRFNQSHALSEEADVAFQLFGEFLLEGNKKSSAQKSQADSCSPHDGIISNIVLLLPRSPFSNSARVS